MISSIVKNSPIMKKSIDNEKFFPIQLKKKFYKLRMKLNVIKELKENEKLGKDGDGKYIVFKMYIFNRQYAGGMVKIGEKRLNIWMEILMHI